MFQTQIRGSAPTPEVWLHLTTRSSEGMDTGTRGHVGTGTIIRDTTGTEQKQIFVFLSYDSTLW